MYSFSYAEVLDEMPGPARSGERDILLRSIELLETAEAKGVRSRETIEALLIARRVWAYLVEDLASPDNQLPKPLRASLISVGLWILGEVERIRLGQSDNLRGLIEVTAIVSEGLQ